MARNGSSSSPSDNDSVDGDAIDLRLLDFVTATSDGGVDPVTTVMIPIRPDGRFSALLNTGAHRVDFHTLPEEYVVASIAHGPADAATYALDEPVQLPPDGEAEIEIRLARRAPGEDRSRDGGPQHAAIRGRVTDRTTGLPEETERIFLCCYGAHPLRRLSAALDSEGYFEFASVPPARYRMMLSGPSQRTPVDHWLDVSTEDRTDLVVASQGSATMMPVSILLTSDGRPLASGQSIVAILADDDGLLATVRVREAVPSTSTLRVVDSYTVRVTQIPNGYAVRSITAGDIDITADGRVRAGMSHDIRIQLYTPQ